MKDNEILVYNERCAKFIGLKSNIHQQYLLPIRHDWYGDHSYREWGDSDSYEDNNVFEGYRENCWALYITELTFHYNWNWIHRVIEVIESLGYQVDFISRLLADEETEKDHCCWIWNDEHTKKIAEVSSNISKKEAVISAINNFLIFYNGKGSK